MQEGPLRRFRQMVQAGELAPDTAQELAAEKLQLLANRLAQYSEPRLGDLLPFARRRRSAPVGLYLYGGVGRGKTMLLDLFFEIEAIPVLGPEQRNEAHRLIDVLYDNGVGLIAWRRPSRMRSMRRHRC
jgi:cell division protein ZapE